jgi:hypothetical protein
MPRAEDGPPCQAVRNNQAYDAGEKQQRKTGPPGMTDRRNSATRRNDVVVRARFLAAQMRITWHIGDTEANRSAEHRRRNIACDVITGQRPAGNGV